MLPVALLATSLPPVCAAENKARLVNRGGTLYSEAPLAAENVTAHDVSATKVTAGEAITIGNVTLDEDTLRMLIQGTTTTTPQVSGSSGTCGALNCSAYAVCEDNKHCVCAPGYRGSGTACEMINPCVEDTHNCRRDGSEVCLLTAPGANRCACAVGFAPDATSNDVCVVQTVFTDGRLLKVYETSDITYLFRAPLDAEDRFGRSIANIGDLDGE